MAIIGRGTIGRYPSVSECRALPALSEAYGLDAVSTMIADGEAIDVPCVPPVNVGDMTIEIYRHPDLLIGDTERLWRKEYLVKAKYGTRYEYDDFHPCYLYAEEYYEAYRGSAIDE